MDSFTIELVSNASGELFPDKTLSFFPKVFTGATIVGEAMGGCNFRNILPINVPKKKGWKFKFFDEKFSISTSTFYLEPGLYTCITDFVEGMNTLNQEKNNHNEICITAKVSRRRQKVLIMLANYTSFLAFCSTDLGHIFGNNVGNKFGLLMIGKGPYEPELA